MFYLISIILLITAINVIHLGANWFAILMISSVGFAIAGSIGSISSRLHDISNRLIIKKEHLVNGDTKITLALKQYTYEQNKDK